MTNQQLKAHCEDVIANPQDHLDWVVDMARVALASLEATPGIFEWRFKSEPVSAWVTLPIEKLQQAKDTFGDMVEYRFWCSAPPVAEHKPVRMPQRYTTRIGTDLVSGAEVTRVVMIPDEHGQWLSIYDVEHEFNRMRGIPS